MSLLLREVEVEGVVVDVRVAGDQVTDVRPGQRPSPEDEVVDGGGGALLPGLHDHHVHVHALAAAMDSVAVGPPAVTSADAFAVALRAAAAAGSVRAVGYHERVAGPLDRHGLAPSKGRACYHAGRGVAMAAQLRPSQSKTSAATAGSPWT